MRNSPMIHFDSKILINNHYQVMFHFNWDHQIKVVKKIRQLLKKRSLRSSKNNLVNGVRLLTS
jgi:hypothetical protein